MQIKASSTEKMPELLLKTFTKNITFVKKNKKIIWYLLTAALHNVKI